MCSLSKRIPIGSYYWAKYRLCHFDCYNTNGCGWIIKGSNYNSMEYNFRRWFDIIMLPDGFLYHFTVWKIDVVELPPSEDNFENVWHLNNDISLDDVQPRTQISESQWGSGREGESERVRENKRNVCEMDMEEMRIDFQQIFLHNE